MNLLKSLGRRIAVLMALVAVLVAPSAPALAINTLSLGRVKVGQLVLSTPGYLVQFQYNTVARTDTSAKNLFTLPAGAIPISVEVYGTTASNAGTSANVSVGLTGQTGTYYVNALDVKGATGTGQQFPAATNLLSTALSAAATVTGTYAETGTASSAGGPWTIVVAYLKK